ncbi:hypothetical protein [Pararhodobacter sp.]|uniref:hypothetical protein n=1 Tax=Pararhodobacter sp. TaxID=2127056 RepID=UPI002FDD9CB2
MRQFTSTAMTTRPGELLCSADEGGAIITRYGREEYVVIPMTQYRMIMRAVKRLEEATVPGEISCAVA